MHSEDIASHTAKLSPVVIRAARARLNERDENILHVAARLAETDVRQLYDTWYVV
jgi:ABC-type spermidine/putrescine transport system permease subunit II